MDISLWLDACVRNIRYAVRTLTHTPGFTVTAVLTLALGIGANTAVFSAINSVLLKPLPFPGGDRLMRLDQTREGSAGTSTSSVRLGDWNRRNSTFEAITGYYTEDVSDTSGDLPERVRRALVAPRFFQVWGVAPSQGRTFTDADYQAGGAPGVVISDRYRRRRFGAEQNVVGRTVRLDNVSLAILGVMPASFQFADRTVDVYGAVRENQFRRADFYTAFGRLKRGATVEQARADLGRAQAALATQYPDTDSKLRIDVVPLKDVTVGSLRSSLWLLFGAVSVLLLITCVNIGSLLLSRAAHRQEEIAVRLSLGATRAAVVAQMIVESALLALAGAAAGLLIAAAAAAGLRLAATDLPRIDEIALDRNVLLYTLTTTVGVALLCGLLSAIRTARGGVVATAKSSSRTQVSTRNSLQWLLVGTQVALSVTLLVGAGLLARSVQELSRIEPGFDPSRVLTFRVGANFSEVRNMSRVAQRIDGTIDAVRALPGVDAAASAMSLPGLPFTYELTFKLHDAQGDAQIPVVAESRMVSPEYFATLQIPLVEGEMCRRQPPDGPPDAMVNQTFVRRYLSARLSAIGVQLEADRTPLSRIVGIVGDARERGVDREAGPIVYPCLSAPTPMPFFLARTRGEPAAITASVRRTLKQLEPLRAVYDIMPLDERIGATFTQNRLRTLVLILFAMMALTLACVGLYGTLSYVVTLRRREIALRLALGASRQEMIRHFVMQGLRIAAVACLCGLGLSFAFSRVLSGMLYGVSPSDSLTMTGVVGFVLTVAAVAALVPAMRAAFVQPMTVLRE
jgi:predicted permease